MTTLADIFGVPRWRVRLPRRRVHNHIAHAINGHQQPLHERVQGFYRRLPDNLPHAIGDHRPALLPFADALLFVADHPGWRLRKIQGEWVAIK